LYPNASIAYRILLTIPVTVASIKKSFSKLKLLKSYLRSIMSQERLNELTILSIEQDLLENIEYKSLISNLVAQTDEPCVEIFFDDFYIYFLYKASFFLDRPRPHNSQGRP
jgi:hypothetical protein